MKTIKKDGKIKRVTDEVAFNMVNEHGWNFCPKSEYKQAKTSEVKTDTPKQEKKVNKQKTNKKSKKDLTKSE